MGPSVMQTSFALFIDDIVSRFVPLHSFSGTLGRSHGFAFRAASFRSAGLAGRSIHVWRSGRLVPVRICLVCLVHIKDICHSFHLY